MYIEKLSLTHFRNYEELLINLDKSINLFIGDNAQGKTNILESIYLCSTARSHRTTQEKEVIKWSEEGAHISLVINKKNLSDQIDFHITQKGKTILVNKLPVKKLGDLFGLLMVVMFSPEDLQLVKKSPKERRRFLDLELCQIDKLYYHALRQYHKALKQRNNLLKDFKKYNTDRNFLEIWDEQLLEYGHELIQKRIQFIENLNEIAKQIHFEISGEKEDLEVVYEPNVKLEDYSNKLKKNQEKDILTATTSIGPHRDDLKFLINKKDVKIFGSQGQQRTVVLYLKLAELKLIEIKTSENPILLLDDVLSELDTHRQEYLFNYTKNIQTLITGTGIEQSVWNNQKIGKLFNVKNGNISLVCL
jgi:DNA replication and repair protein RecF